MGTRSPSSRGAATRSSARRPTSETPAGGVYINLVDSDDDSGGHSGVDSGHHGSGHSGHHGGDDSSDHGGDDSSDDSGNPEGNVVSHKDIEQIWGEMAKLEEKVEQVQKKRKKHISALEVGVEELETKVGALEEAQDKTDLAKVGQRVCALENAIELESKVTGLEKPRCALAFEVGTSKQKLNAIADALAKLEAKVASLEEKKN
ncbi:hypothetical protein GQ55_9G276700 [Panicum hallii var. hallii]|uniref:Uncharacterized protein n=1 Tax=Panicum hallii var. hallii TaxID=1504633 RepID=A0A2T7C7F4_9POAL|nr:hypothetical protein GQ55_9G276700 [Panicum hallii var. hallii]